MLADNSLTHLITVSKSEDTINCDTEIHSDALLQASRRVDWRFLLPDPRLGQVAYIGPAGGTLLESLRLFSASLTIIEMGDNMPPALYDVVVVSNQTTTALRQITELLKPGGWLYIEAFGPFLHRGLRCLVERPCLPGGYMAALQQIDIFDKVEAYWHWPDFESCTKIIPLNDQAAFRHVLVRHRSSMGAQLKSTLVRWLLWSGLLTNFIPCFSVVAHRGETQLRY